MNPMNESERRDFLEICNDRFDLRSTLLASQLPPRRWHDQAGDPTTADSILDRVLHIAHRFDLDGESLRKVQGQARLTAAAAGGE